MFTVCHLFDKTNCWEHRAAVGQLLDRLPPDRFRQILAVTHPDALSELRRLGRKTTVIRGPVGAAAFVAYRISEFLRKNGVDLIHAWGPDAAATASPAGMPMVLELFDPHLAVGRSRLIRTIARTGRLTVVCPTEWVRRRLIEGGVSADACTVVRPGVDFGVINAARKRPIRTELGIADNHFVVLVPEPASRRSGQRDAFLAVTLVNHLDRKLRIVLPGESDEADRIERIARSLPTEHSLVRTYRRFAFEELVPHSDVLVIAAEGDTSTTSIAWAMAAKTTVIGSAVHSVTEFVAHKVGGLLFKRSAGRFNPVPLARVLADREAQAKVRETAHGMAYESFGLRRFVEEHLHVYESLLRGGAAGEGATISPAIQD